jgi:multicomponent Na+:H+ antiporter subunit D
MPYKREPTMPIFNTLIDQLLSTGFPPGLILILGGALIAFLPRYGGYAAAIVSPFLTLLYITHIPQSAAMFDAPSVHLAGHDLLTIWIHPYSHIFSTVFCLAALAGGIYALNQFKRREMAAAYIYAGSAIGVTFAGDFLTLFLFWEIMAIASTLVIWSHPTAAARKAGIRYAVMHFIGGVLLMAGIVAHLTTGGQLEISHQTTLFADITAPDFFTSPASLAPWLMLLGILVNTATPPFSSWLPDAYPESSVTGMVFLSAFTTKTAVFVLLTVFAGNKILIPLGLFMVFYGIVYAILENDMRRILAYSIINQVGFMVTGAGIGTTLALNGAAAHAFCHIIYKALLLMSAGSVIHQTGKRKCSELGGLYRTMPITMVCGIIGALAISAFPFTSGFISKSMISSAAYMPEFEWVWYLLLAASAGVFLHAGIKFPWFVFFQRDSGLRPKEPPENMQLAMIALSVMCIVPGFYPQIVYFLLPTTVDYDAYAHGHAVTQLQLLLFSGLAFFMMLPMLARTRTISLDIDWLYRKPLTHILLLIDRLAFFLKDLITAMTLRYLQGTVDDIASIHSAEGIMARNWPIGVTMTWVILLLGVFLAVYFWVT